MQDDIVEARLQIRPFRHRLLHPVLAKAAVARLKGRKNTCNVMFLCYGGDLDCVWFAASLNQGGIERFANTREIGGGIDINIRHEALLGKTIEERAAKLASAARALKQRSGSKAPFCLAFVTDSTRGLDARMVAAALPAGTAVIFRDYDNRQRDELAQSLKVIASTRKLLLFVGGDAGLAQRVGADGVHLRSDQLTTTVEHPGLLISASCHSAEELERAGALGADVALLGPAFPTQSHPGAEALGPRRLKAFAARSAVPVVAIGGVDETNAAQLAGDNVAGFAAIGAFAAEHSSQ